jgi:hypothetical protein
MWNSSSKMHLKRIVGKPKFVGMNYEPVLVQVQYRGLCQVLTTASILGPYKTGMI